MIADGHDTPSFDPGNAPEGPADLRSAGRSEGDLLAERRARRTGESGEAVLTRRAEAAEATVQTLERHVATLQHRLREAEEEQRRLADLLDMERGAALEREHELRRVKQREYAEQQQRVEAEDRLLGAEREGRAESEAIASRLAASEDGARELADRMQAIQRQLAEAEQAAAADGAALRRAERVLEDRVGALEARGSDMQRGLQDERAARERAERLLESMRHGHRQMEALLGDVRAIVQRLIAGARAEAPPEPAGVASTPAEPGPVAAAPAEAEPPAPTVLAAAPSPSPSPPSDDALMRRPEPGVQRLSSSVEARGAEMSEALAAAVERLRARAEAVVPHGQYPAAGFPQGPAHKHSLSLIGRWRNRRKQRRGR